MAEEKLRLDKWLWQARFFKSRALAADAASSGRTRLNGNRVKKSSTPVRVGDVITFVQAKEVRVVRVLDVGERRGPASEAQLLYEIIGQEP